jgi:hypothetical protein
MSGLLLHVLVTPQGRIVGLPVGRLSGSACGYGVGFARHQRLLSGTVRRGVPPNGQKYPITPLWRDVEPSASHLRLFD